MFPADDRHKKEGVEGKESTQDKVVVLGELARELDNVKDGELNTSTTEQPILVDGSKDKEKEKPNEKVKKQGTYKKTACNKRVGGDGRPGDESEMVTSKKRLGEELMEVDMSGGKEDGVEDLRMDVTNKKLKFAGLVVHSCKNQ